MTQKPHSSASGIAAGEIRTWAKQRSETRITVFHLVLAVATLLLPILWQGGRSFEKLTSNGMALAKLEGSQQTRDLDFEKLKAGFKNLELRAFEDRQKVESLQKQMGYRLEFEGTAKAIHPEVEWPR